jgi:hypothetical protein
MKKFKQQKMEYSHRRENNIVEVEIKDETRRTIYRTKFNIKDRKAILLFLDVLENYSGLSVAQILKEKLSIGEWW